VGAKMAKKKKDWIFRIGVVDVDKDPEVKEITKELDGIIDNVGEIVNSFRTTETVKNENK